MSGMEGWKRKYSELYHCGGQVSTPALILEAEIY